MLDRRYAAVIPCSIWSGKVNDDVVPQIEGSRRRGRVGENIKAAAAEVCPSGGGIQIDGIVGNVDTGDGGVCVEVDTNQWVRRARRWRPQITDQIVVEVGRGSGACHINASYCPGCATVLQITNLVVMDVLGGTDAALNHHARHCAGAGAGKAVNIILVDVYRSSPRRARREARDQVGVRNPAHGIVEYVGGAIAAILVQPGDSAGASGDAANRVAGNRLVRPGERPGTVAMVYPGERR